MDRVRDCNAHDELVSALEHFLAIVDDANFGKACEYVPELDSIADHARAALAKADGEDLAMPERRRAEGQSDRERVEATGTEDD